MNDLWDCPFWLFRDRIDQKHLERRSIGLSQTSYLVYSAPTL